MPDQRISLMTEKVAPLGTDLVVIVDMDTGVTKKAYIVNVPPGLHHISHENGGGDELSVAGLSGMLADPQTPAGHKIAHQHLGSDEMNVAGLSGLLADPQTPLGHKSSHEDGGGDKINVTGLPGVLADKQDANKIQGHTVDETAIADDRVLVYKAYGNKYIYEAKTTPGVHALSHQDGGGDELNVAGLSGVLADKQNADKIQGHAVEEAARADNTVLVYKVASDKFVYEAKGTPAGHHTSHELGGGDQIDVTGLTGASGGGGGGGDFLVMQVFS